MHEFIKYNTNNVSMMYRIKYALLRCVKKNDLLFTSTTIVINFYTHFFNFGNYLTK